MQITNRGKMWHIINRATGKTVAFRAQYKEAVKLLKNPQLLWRCTEDGSAD